MPKLSIPPPKKLPSGHWRVQFQIEGKRYSVTDDTKRKCSDKAEKMAKDILAGIEQEKRSSFTVGKAMDKFIESQSRVLSAATIVGYKNIRKNHLQSIMDMNLSDLTSDDIQAAINDEIEAGKSPKSIRNYYALLTVIIRKYRPKFTPKVKLPQKGKYEVHILTEDELVKVVKAAEGSRYELPILLAAWLGLRASEIRGLKYSDIQNGRIHVQRAVVQGEGKAVEKLTKTEAGDRWIVLPDDISKLIPEVEEDQKDRYICPIRQNVLLKAFHSICKEAGVEPCRFHDLRHFQASEAHSLGIPDKYVMKRMGHATDNMLKTVYQHAMTDKEDIFTQVINSRMSALFSE